MRVCCLDVLDDCVEVSLGFQDGDFVKGFRSNKAVESRYHRGADVMRLLLRRRDHDVIGGRSRSTQLPSWKFQGNILYCHALNRSDHNFASVLATRDACDPELRERLRTNDCPDLQSDRSKHNRCSANNSLIATSPVVQSRLVSPAALSSFLHLCL